MMKEHNRTNDDLPAQITVEDVSEDANSYQKQGTTLSISQYADLKSPINHQNFYIEISQTPKEALRTTI